jgi:hypothetical protein
MSLSGKLETMGLPEVLQWIAMSRKTGTLFLRRRSVEKRLVFREGALYSSWSNHPRESLGQFLIRDRRVSEEQLFTALLHQEEHGQMLGTILVSEGLLTEEQLHQALKTKAEETVYDLFLWPDGEFQFQDGEMQQIFHLELPVTHVIMEGIRRVDEWKRIRAVFPPGDLTFEVPAGATAADPAAEQALRLAEAGRSVPEIALEMRRSEFDAASLLFALHQKGLLTVGAVRPRDPGRDTVRVIEGMLGEAAAQMRLGRYQAAQAAYEEVLAVDRLNQHAKKGVAAAAAAIAKQRAARAVPLDKVPVLVMSLAALTRETLEPNEGFVLSRINGSWDVRSILKICPIAEQEAISIFARLLARNVIELH